MLPPIALAREPIRAEVLGYVDNAIEAARVADESGAGLESTSSWAERVIESEAFRTYDHARRVAESSLRAMSDSDAERYGFRVAKSIGQGPISLSVHSPGRSRWRRPRE
jgi:hypothetical protein